MNLIKKHRPKYNVRLKDDKRYPYIKIHWAEPFPKVTVTRQMVDEALKVDLVRILSFRSIRQAEPPAGPGCGHRIGYTQAEAGRSQ